MVQTYETKRSKHIDIKHYFVKYMILEGKFKLAFVSSKNQLADIMTKALPVSKFDS